MANQFWPIVDLRVRTERLELRPVTEPDLEGLALIVPPDAEPDPGRPRHPVEDPWIDRGIALHQSYWSSLATWTASAWRLMFLVVLGDDPVGVQELEATDFPRRGVVETGSWLVSGARGKGIGKEMRAGVLHLAFTGLGAIEAESAAWWDNDASLGVSRALGYRENGEYLHVDGPRRDRMTRLRLTSFDWVAAGERYPTKIEGLEACTQLFGRPRA